MAGANSNEPSDTVTFNDIDWKRQEEQDNANLQALLNESVEKGDYSEGLFSDRPLDTGEKADDAQDFEDISDDDLPEEEEASLPGGGDLPGLTDDAGTSNDTDDLFGEGRGSSPFGDFDDNVEMQDGEQPAGNTEEEPSGPTAEEEDLVELNFPGHREWLANQDLSIPAPAESEADLLKQWWPTFVQGGPLDFNELLPPKKAHFVPKVPLKQPKPLQPTKVSLDLAPDQEKSFRAAGPIAGDKRKRALEAEAKGLIAIIEESSDEEAGDEGFDFDEPEPDEKLGGILSEPLASEIEIVDDQPMDDWEREILGHSAKRRKVEPKQIDYMSAPRFAVPSFDNLEEVAMVSAKRPILDMNDPHLLLEEVKANVAAKRQRLGGNFRAGNNNLSKTLSKRFNISNDEAYDALKENHQSKVRAAINNVTVEHSVPALRLQWPYYKVKLFNKEARSLHRPTLKFQKFINQPISFSRPGLRKRKEARLMSVAEAFKETKDLTLADHYSTATLIEYSEEQPIVLSNFGMGSRVINYYRRKDAEDTDRPVPEDRVGDTTILLPEDKSPFANFGFVDPGETVRAIHNAMYRAPIYKHESKNTDFLVIRNSTGVDGTSWHIRNIDNLFVAGQQLPFVEIPSPHSRKVTNAAKNRVKMIAFRKIRRSDQKCLRISELTAHIPDTTDMQNRQKLKEILVYDKVEKVWRPPEGAPIPDSAQLQALVKPEDVCMIDAMQVGLRHLHDSGYAAVTEKEEKDDALDTLPIEHQLTPWNTSKAFAEATTGKAMLKLHGEGDPSGCGLAFSMIRTSMKGGYIGAVQGPNATSAAAMEAQKKANNGHTYNVKKQEELYNAAIRDIWEKQKRNLSDADEHLQNDLEDVDEDERFGVAPTPHSMPTPAPFDDSVSQVSRISMDNPSGKFMRITRKVQVGDYGQTQEVVETVRDVRVWREYMKRRKVMEAANSEYDFPFLPFQRHMLTIYSVYTVNLSGDAEQDRVVVNDGDVPYQRLHIANDNLSYRIQKELDRLERNKDRRHAREKQKSKQSQALQNAGGQSMAGSPSASGAANTVEKPTGTTRKCANCGQAGHIRTNKKLCPLLNGTMKSEDAAPNVGGFGAVQPPSFG
ncbi:transcription initiation factor TFIID subunit 1 protein [Rutstroemia sp. NJR-2017a BBW]|nr:transcription initiation factor TFIID subunit 1 protein [Rutstroemia sp. NJR-2017a BBW]